MYGTYCSVTDDSNHPMAAEIGHAGVWGAAGIGVHSLLDGFAIVALIEVDRVQNVLFGGTGAAFAGRQEQPRRGVDQTGDQDLAGDVDDRGVGRHRDVLADGGDASVLDHEGGIFEGGAGDGVDPGAAEDGGLRLGRIGGLD